MRKLRLNGLPANVVHLWPKVFYHKYWMAEKLKYDSKGKWDMTDQRRNVYFFTNRIRKRTNKPAR